MIDPRPDRRYRLAQFLAEDAADFVAAAYRALLGREPDPQGAADYERRLAGGASRVEILAILSGSAEGRAYGARVDGLGLAGALERAGRWPLVGWPLRVAHALWGLPATLVELRRVEARERDAAAALAEVRTHAGRLQEELAAARAGGDRLEARLAEVALELAQLRTRAQSLAQSQRADAAEIMGIVAELQRRAEESRPPAA